MDELDKLRMSSMSWISLYCKLDELDKLRMCSMIWLSCTVSWMSWLS